ncbi:MAG: DUF357 domain-containing protein [archaeon]|nr:DUF357 domain-containing protein [archaeon]
MVDLSFFNIEENEKTEKNKSKNNDSFNQTSNIDEELKEKLKKYKSLTSKALKKIRLNYSLSLKEKKIAQDFIGMADAYFKDAKYFEKQKDLLTALAAFSYAHAWLDAGVRAGLLDAQGDDTLFVLKD